MNVVFNYLDITICVIVFMCIGILVVEKFLRQKKKKINKKDCLHIIYMFPTHATKYMYIRKYSKRLVYLNTNINLYFKCLALKHYY